MTKFNAWTNYFRLTFSMIWWMVCIQPSRVCTKSTFRECLRKTIPAIANLLAVVSLSTSSSSSMEWRALRRPAMKVCCFDIENLHGLQFVNTHFCARTHRSPRRKSFWVRLFFLCLFTAHQRTQESWVKSNRKKSQSSGKKKKITKLRAKCQKKKTDEPLRVVLRVCKSEDLKNSITSAKKSIFLFSTTLKREPTEPSNLRHHRECVVSTESVCARVGRSLIQFHCLSRASEINQKKKCWFAFAFGLGSPLTLCAFVCLIQSLRASRRTVGRMKSRGKANDDEWSRLDGSSSEREILSDPCRGIW